jgi:NADPH:quinone reductase-like Zn-dependent oxidoreductase
MFLIPSILGGSFGGKVKAIGPQVTKFKFGDKVAVQKRGAPGNQYGSYQRYVITKEGTAFKVPEGVDATVPATLIGNLSTVVGLLTVSARLERPTFDEPIASQGKKVLIYGGSSSVGSLSVQ